MQATMKEGYLPMAKTPLLDPRNEGREAVTIWDKIIQLYHRSDRFFHLLVGMPSYDKYLEHMKIYHPDKIPKSQKDFFKEALEAKYGAGGAKC